MTVEEFNEMQLQAARLRVEAKRYRQAARELGTFRAETLAGRQSHLEFVELAGCAFDQQRQIADAVDEVTQPLRGDILRAAEVVCQERARSAFLRACLLTAQIEAVLNAGRAGLREAA